MTSTTKWPSRNSGRCLVSLACGVLILLAGGISCAQPKGLRLLRDEDVAYYHNPSARICRLLTDSEPEQREALIDQLIANLDREGPAWPRLISAVSLMTFYEENPSLLTKERAQAIFYDLLWVIDSSLPPGLGPEDTEFEILLRPRFELKLDTTIVEFQQPWHDLPDGFQKWTVESIVIIFDGKVVAKKRLGFQLHTGVGGDAVTTAVMIPVPKPKTDTERRIGLVIRTTLRSPRGLEVTCEDLCQTALFPE